jgi:O-antigen/teichoic acid export membrane protein
MLLTNRTGLIGMVCAGTAVLNLGLNYLLISNFGMTGAALATLVSFLAIGFGSYWLSQRALPLPLPVTRVAAAILTAVALYLVSLFWEPKSLVLAVLMKGTLLAAYPVLVWKARICSDEEIGTLVSAGQTVAAKVSRLLGRASTREESI